MASTSKVTPYIYILIVRVAFSDTVQDRGAEIVIRISVGDKTEALNRKTQDPLLYRISLPFHLKKGKI